MTIHPEEILALGILVACIALLVLFPEETAYWVYLLTRMG